MSTSIKLGETCHFFGTFKDNFPLTLLAPDLTSTDIKRSFKSENNTTFSLSFVVTIGSISNGSYNSPLSLFEYR